MDLEIGRLDQELEDSVAAGLERIGVPASADWRRPVHSTTISLLNLASVCLFTDYVARLEGFANSAAALGHTRFQHLPLWQMSIWLPVLFQPPREPTISTEGWPVFLGSCQCLLAELAEIQQLSEMELGATPDGYEAMRADYIAFVRSGFALRDDRSIIQWIWRGLHDGAELAIRDSVPLLGM